MRLFRQGLFAAAPSPMSKGTVVAWIGLTVAIGTGMGLLLRAQKVVVAKTGNEAIVSLEHQPSELREEIVTGESKRKPDDERPRPDGDGQFRRTAMHSILPPALPSPLYRRGSFLGHFPRLNKVHHTNKDPRYQAHRFHRRFRPVPVPGMMKTARERSMRPTSTSRNQRNARCIWFIGQESLHPYFVCRLQEPTEGIDTPRGDHVREHRAPPEGWSRTGRTPPNLARPCDAGQSHRAEARGWWLRPFEPPTHVGGHGLFTARIDMFHSGAEDHVSKLLPDEPYS